MPERRVIALTAELDRYRAAADQLASAVLSLRAVACHPVETPIAVIDRTVAQGDAAIEAWEELVRAPAPVHREEGKGR